MSVDMRNSEGYLDLTAYEAIKKVEQEQRSGRAFRPIVYICSPYAGDIAGNVDAAFQLQVVNGKTWNFFHISIICH